MSSTLRVLCLHGFRGSGAGLEPQMRPLIAGLEPELELVHVDAPARARGGPGWWNAVSIAGVDPSVKHYEGWDETRAWVRQLFAGSAPFDGVFGFSQGAALAALLVGMRATNNVDALERPLAFSFAVLVGGFVSNDPAHAALYQASECFDLPSFHLIGRADRIVPREASLALAARFVHPTVFEHDGGHVIASTAEARREFANFLRARRS